MIFTAMRRNRTAARRGFSSRVGRVFGAMALAALLSACGFGAAAALADTTLTIDLKGVTPNGVDSWLTLSLTGRFDVQAGETALGRVTANPTAEQQAQGQTDTLTLPDAAAGDITLTPVAEDFEDGFTCEGPIPLTVTAGEANRRTVFAYARRGLFTVRNVLAGTGDAAGWAEFVVFSEQGVLQWGFTTAQDGTYTAAQALPNGAYRLVQMRAPTGALLLADPVPFTVNTYYGNPESLTLVSVENQPAPTGNAVTGNPAFTVAGFAGEGAEQTATLTLSGLCAGDNTLPLDGYTVVFAPVALLDAAGNALAAANALCLDAVTPMIGDGGITCAVQPLGAEGRALGDPIPCVSGQTVSLTDAAGASVTYLNENGAASVPAGFHAGALEARLRYAPSAEAAPASAAASARVTATVRYTFQYTDIDGMTPVTADSAVTPASAELTLPDGRVELSLAANVETAQDGAPVIVLSAPTSALTAGALPKAMAAALPAGVRAQKGALPAGVTLLRTREQDLLVFTADTWLAGEVRIPIEAGDIGALTVWALDPQTLPRTEGNPQGLSLKAAAHEAQPLLDALLSVQSGSYARLDINLPGAVTTGKTATEPVALASGSVAEQAGGAGAAVGGLGALLTASDGSVYGALTEDDGTFTVFGDADTASGTLRVTLPANSVSAATGENGVETHPDLALPADGIAVVLARMSGLTGTVYTADGRPVAGVAVELLTGGNAAASSVTDALGAYALEGLSAGDYALRLTLPADSQAVFTPREGLSAGDQSVYTFEPLSLAYGEQRALDFTATLLAGLTGTVSQGDAPAAGLTVTLTGTDGASVSTQTDDTGAYAFTALAPGDYALTLALPPQYALVQVNGETARQTGEYSVNVSLAAGETRADRLALEQTATITGRIGSLGAGQSIAAASLSAQITATTAQDGSFSFEGLIGGDYTVYAPLAQGQTLLAGSPWRVTQQGDMVWITVSVAAGATYALPDVEFVAVTSIEGVAYMDENGDCRYQDGEQRMSGVAVALQQQDGDGWTDVANLTTDAYGRYAFDNLTAGIYRVVSQAIDGVSVSAVGDSALALGETALGVKTSAELTLQNGDRLSGQSDVALAQPAKLNVAAFFDSNENGTRGEYERPIAGVLFEAVPAADPQGSAVASAATNVNGEATLADLAPGEYALRVTLPDGYLYTVAGGKWNTDTSCVGGTDSLTAFSAAFSLLSGQTAGAAAAAIPVGSFSGRVWNDENNNGVMDDGEPGVPGVQLTLSGTRTGNTYQLTTDETGAYRFALLRNDAYNLTATLPDGLLFARYTQTGGDSRSVFTADGSAATRQFVVADAQDVADKNVGVIQKAALTGIAFLDTNYNGVYDEGEPPYAGVTVEVIKNTNSRSMGKAVTGADGRYAFDTLRGGDYRVRAILPNDGCIFTLVPARGEGLYNRFAAREGRRENSIDSLILQNGETAETCVGVAMGGTLSGTVFLDAKYDGVLSGSDKKASGVKVQLVDAAGTLVGTATTNANGRYLFEGIMPGDYTVRFQRRNNYAFTRYRPAEDNGNHVQALAKDGYGETEAIPVAMGQTVEHINAGMLPSSTLTGMFFDDLNDNGLMDAGEAGFTDGRVRLLSGDGELDLTETVAADGTYFFDGVMPGDYTLTYLLPENATMARVVANGNTLEAQGLENVLGGLRFESGKSYTAPLTGAVTLGTFSGYAYHDANGNGLRDEGEDVLSGVEITLKPSGSGLDTATVATGADGRFSVTNLRPSAYTLSLTLPEGYIFSAGLAAGGLTLDTAQTDTLACPWAALVNRAEYAVGAVRPATVRGSVWLDENRDGRHASDERLLSGLSYELFDETLNKVVKTARSGDDGYVTFSNVRPSAYTVRFTLPEQAQPANDPDDTFAVNGSVMSQSGIVIREGETFEDIQGGLVSYTSIGGTVALDENGARTPQAGVTVSLYQANGATPLLTATTDESGAYRFDGLWPDQYRLTVTQPSGTIFVRPDDPNYSADASVVTGSADGIGTGEPFELEMADHRLAMDVILIKPARVGDQVWLDSNQNGLIDADEPSVNGVTIELLADGEVAYATVSNEWGYYELADVYPGTYTLRAAAYPELEITKSIPALRIISSCLTSGDGSEATSEPFSVESGSRNLDYNLGYILREGETLPAGIAPGDVQRWPAASVQTK